MYLTHFGEIDYSQHNAQFLRYWISEYVKLGERFEPGDLETTHRLETDLREMTPAKLTGKGLSEDELRSLLENDFRLNALGIAHWWRSTQNG